VKLPQSLFWLIVLVGLVAAFGCRVLASPTGNSDPADDLVSTSVAATVAAGAILDAPIATPAVPSTTTQVPSPEPTALPTATLAEQPAPTSGSSLLVAYVDLNRNLWVWRSDAARQLTTSGDVENVQLSSDGAWLAFTRTSNFRDYSLWAIRSDGSQETALMDQPDFENLPRPPGAVSVMPFAFTWQPGTHTLAFNTRPTFEGLGLMLNDDLWLVNADTRERRQLLEPGDGGMFTFSPDGSRIAVSTPDDISLVDVDGGNRQDGVLTFPRVSTYSEYMYYPGPQWSSGSDFLRVVIPPPASLEKPDDPSQVWHIPADGSAASLVGSFNTAPPFYPVLSPDLEKVAYLRQVGEMADNSRELHIAGADGTADLAYLREANLMFSAWSPDSEQFVFMVGDNLRSYLGQVGMTPAPLTDAVSVTGVRWVNPAHFLFITRSGENVELRLGTVGDPSELIVSASGDAAPFLDYDFTH
jgi:dipeptidyl aminopeptidase/acylaminoacyl peptidase